MVNRNLIFLFCCVLMLVGVLIYIEHHFPNDGQLFVAILGILTPIATIFTGAARQVLGLQSDKQESTTNTSKQDVKAE